MNGLFEIMPLYEILFFSAWGGVSRFLVDNKDKKSRLCRKNLLAHLSISCFAGVLAAIYSQGQDHGDMMIVLFSGVAGWTGKPVLTWLTELIKVKGR